MPAQDSFVSASARIKCIIAIDYGTTYTGISYVFTNETDSDIRIVQTWPGEGRDRTYEWKTPTVIAYGNENGFSGNKWGYMVGPEMKSYSWTKLLLDKNAPKGKYDDPSLANIVSKGMLQLPEGKSAKDVCQDYLTEVRKFVMERMDREQGKDFMDLTPVECWITVPATWLDEAKDATREAAIGAGFAARDMDSVNLISEPEAAAIRALKNLASSGAQDAIEPGDNIIICDCGGGTVDLTTYTITNTYPMMEFDELVVGEGGKCGGTYIDRNFYTLLTERFGKSFAKLDFRKTGPRSRFMQSFENLKRDFPKGFDQEKSIGPLKVTSRNPTHYDEDDGEIKLSRSDVMSLFDPVTDQVIGLVDAQVAAAQKLDKNVGRIILVGGFGDSPYLFERLQSWCNTNGNIKLICPPNPQAAIVTGAALRGLAGTGPGQKMQRRHYGYRLSRPYIEGVDVANRIHQDPFQVGHDKRCVSEMSWKIAKGETITPNTIRTQSVYLTLRKGGTATYTLDLYSCNLDIAQLSIDHERVVKVGEVVVDYSSVNLDKMPTAHLDGVLCYRVDLDIKIAFGAEQGVLVFSSWIKGRQVGTATLSFAK